MTHSSVRLGLPLLAVLAAGRTTLGTEFDSTSPGATPITFHWKGWDSVPGTMNATVSDGMMEKGL
jgi:hypothetical protein